MTIKRVLVIGGAGKLGKAVVERLAEEGFDVSVGSRSTASVDRTFRGRFPGVALEVTDPNSLRKALSGFDAVHLNLPSGPTFEASFRVESGGGKAAAGVAKELGIQRLSYVSGAGVGPAQEFPPSKAKFQAENAIRESGVPFNIWRCSWFFETLPLTVKGGLVMQLGKGVVLAHWLAARDLGTWVARSFKDDRAAGKTFYAFGSKLIPYAEVTQTFQKICHPRKRLMVVPVGFLTFMGKLTGNQEMWFGGQMFRYLENMQELGDASELHSLLGPAETSLEDWCRRHAAGMR